MAPGGGNSANMRFIVEADNRASTELDRATTSARALTGASRQLGETTILTGKSVEAAAAEFDQLYGPAKKAAEATTAIGTAARTTSTTLRGTSNQVGRLTYQLAGMVAGMDGVSPVAGRVVGVLSSMSVGAVATAGAIIGIGAASYVWQEMADKVDGDQKMIARLREEIEKTKDALGQLRFQAANTELATANALLAGRGGLSTVTSRMGLSALLHGAEGFVTGGVGGAAAGYAGTLAGAQAQATADVRQATRDRDSAMADSLASLVRHNQQDHDARQAAIALLKKDEAELRALRGKMDDESIARRVALSGDVSTLSDALFPKSERRAEAATQAARFKQLQRDAQQTTDSLARALPHQQTATEQYDAVHKNDARSIAEGARREIAGDAGDDPATKAIIKAYNARQAAIDKAHKKQIDSEKATWLAVEDVVMGSVDALVRGQISLGRAVLQAALAPEIMHLQALAAKHMALAAADFATGNYIGGAKETAGAAALTAGAALLGRFAAGGGGGGGLGGGSASYGGGAGVGTFRPDTTSGNNGDVHLTLITQHPSSPDVVDSIVYQMNRGNTLKRPPIPIPPTSGIQVVGSH